MIIMSLTGCKKDKGDPPILPPVESMLIDFSNFEAARKSSSYEIKGTQNSSWEFSAIAAGTWRVIVTGTLLVPTTAFQMAIDQTPENIADKTWQWSFSSTIAQIQYEARLTGKITGNNVEWKMYISQGSAYTDFLWFEGTSAIDGKSGSWTLYHSYENPVAVIQIDWEKPADNQGKIKYTYIKDDPFKDSYIEYGLTSNTLNAYYTIHTWNGVKFVDVSIEWNKTTRNGRVKSLDYLGDENWHCWDSNRVNTECS